MQERKKTHAVCWAASNVFHGGGDERSSGMSLGGAREAKRTRSPAWRWEEAIATDPEMDRDPKLAVSAKPCLSHSPVFPRLHLAVFSVLHYGSVRSVDPHNSKINVGK